MIQETLRSGWVAQIREELVVLTGDYRAAVVLNQLIHWARLSQDIHGLLEKEYRSYLEYHPFFDKGWIITSAQVLCEVTMMGLSRQTMRSILRNLVEAGWLKESKLEKRLEHNISKYHLNLTKIQNDIQSIGYQWDQMESTPNEVPCNNEAACNSSDSPPYAPIIHSLPPTDQEFEHDLQEKKRTDNWTQAMAQIFSETILDGQELKIFPARAEKLKQVLQAQLSDNLENWRKVCQNATRSKFLMGESKRSDFKVTLDWLLEGHNATKVLEGSYGVGDREVIRSELQSNPKNEAQAIEALEEPQAMKELRLWFLERFGAFDYDSWFKETTFEDFNDQSFKIMAKSSFISEQISCRFGIQIKQFLEEKYNRQIIFNIRLKSKESSPITTSTSKQKGENNYDSTQLPS